MRMRFLTTMVLLSLSAISFADDSTEQKPIPASAVSETTAALKVPSPVSPAVINCEYKITPQQEVNNDLVITWSEKAAIQSFTYNNENIDNKLKDLKNCYTQQGYTSYTDALNQSGNIEAIKTQQLNVSSIVDGKTKISKIEDNKWQLKVPLQVVYQNSKEKLTQLLFIDMLVSRKASGELGILQIIAAPRDKIVEKNRART